MGVPAKHRVLIGDEPLLAVTSGKQELIELREPDRPWPAVTRRAAIHRCSTQLGPCRMLSRPSRNMAHKLATFALGRSMDFADEELLKTIAANTQGKQGGLGTMVRELVQSELFQKP